MVVVAVIADNDPLLLVLLHRTFILLTSLERPFFSPFRLPQPSQGYVLGGVHFDNTNGIKHLYIIVTVPVVDAVLLIPDLAIIVIVHPPGNYFCTMLLLDVVIKYV